MSDVFNFDLADGFASGNCPICHALAVDERRWLDSFWREGRRDPETRRRFYASGGFCQSHAWLLHQLVVDADASGAIADVYGGLAAHDLTGPDEPISRGISRRRKGRRFLRRIAECSACAAAADALERKVHFFLELLGKPAGRDRYEQSAGLCLIHLQATVAVDECDDETALYLAGDWRSRLAVAREQLAEFDPTRDRRHLGGGAEGSRRPWTDIIRLYVGNRRLARYLPERGSSRVES